MSERFEEAIVRHCAPTLAGHKCGSLFFYHAHEEELHAQNVKAADALLREKGVRIFLLKNCQEGCLVYLFRPSMLTERFARPDIREFLHQNGYDTQSIQACLITLARKIHCGANFPHEIGVFLDYPLEDVKAFIACGGRDCRCVGCWKAYSNEAEAEKRFALYRKCRDVYLNCYRRGFGVMRLTIAA